MERLELSENNKNYKYSMGLFSALLGNAGTVKPEELIKKYGQLFIDGEEIEDDADTYDEEE